MTDNHIEWWTSPSENATYYKHVGCDTPHRYWIVPLDDCGDPTDPYAECAHCCYVVSLRPRMSHTNQDS